MRKQIIALLLCGIMAVTILGGCGKTQTSSGNETLKEENFALTNASNVNVENTLTGDEKVKDAIVIATTNDMPSAAPYGSNNTVTAMLTNSTFNRLVKVTADNEVVPELATSWSSNEDSTEWTFKLREDVDFQNGKHFTAQDVVFTFEYASSNKNEGITFPINGTELIDSIETPDDYTVVFHLNSTCADWAYYCAQKIMSKETIDEMGIEEGGVIGTGPYTFVSYTPGVSWVMERNENYWGELPKTRQVTFTVITDGNARALSIESGDVDVVFDPNPSDVVKFIDNSSYHIYANQNLSNVFVGINCARAGENRELRRALAMAISRDDIAAVCYEDGKLGSVAYNYVNAASPMHAEVNAISYDPEQAKEILKGLGYDENNHLALRLCAAGKFLPIAEIIQANLAAVNIDVEVSEFSNSGYSASLREDGKYDLYMQQSSTQGPIMNTVTRFFTSDGTSNLMNFKDTKFDGMVEDALKSKTLDEMESKYAEIQQYLADEVPAIPLIDQYLWAIGTKDFYGIDLGNQYYSVDFTNCVVVEE